MKSLFLNLFLFLSISISAQQDTTRKNNAPLGPGERKTNIVLEGKVYNAIITEEGDTLILADIDNVSVSSPSEFKDDEEYQKYLKFRRYATLVYPYAKEAIRIYRESEYAEKHLTKKERKKRYKELDEQLTKEFETPLKNLTKLQGKILVKMIEKETGKTMYDIIKNVKGGFSAFYWNAFSKLYSYDLSEGYVPGTYPILDAVLTDFDLSHRIENESSLKYFNINELRNKKKK